MITNWRAKSTYEIGRTTNHVYLRPHPLLRPFIAHYTLWTQSAVRQPADGLLTLVPDASGCLVMYLQNTGISGCLWGATTRVVTVNNSLGGPPVRIFIEFLPGGLFQFTGMSQSELTDQKLSLDYIMPGFFTSMSNLLEASNSVEQLVTGLDALLLPILLLRTPSAVTLSAVASLREASGLLTVDALSRQENYSPRHLNRVLSDYIGMGPKQFARLLRINAAVRQLGTGQPLTRLAQESGFYDQAHFIRDFREVCGITPGGYLDKMSDFYNEPLKF